MKVSRDGLSRTVTGTRQDRCIVILHMSHSVVEELRTALTVDHENMGAEDGLDPRRIFTHNRECNNRITLVGTNVYRILSNLQVGVQVVGIHIDLINHVQHWDDLAIIIISLVISRACADKREAVMRDVQLFCVGQEITVVSQSFSRK
jgi:hypothetical protein